MGVNLHSGPVEFKPQAHGGLAHDGKAVIQPDQGFFDGLNGELTDKGFLVTSTEELFQWART
ncbi:hypothetical protein LLE87_38870, partial [Paenibacillus polymyxa]|nr:hypothetical protein [Paenibacillus polymyxa]